MLTKCSNPSLCRSVSLSGNSALAFADVVKQRLHQGTRLLVKWRCFNSCQFIPRAPQADGIRDLSHCGKVASEVYPLPPVLNHHQVAGLLVYLREEQRLAIAGHRQASHPT